MIAWCIPAAALGMAYWMRHQWVQAQGMGIRCEAEPSQWPCPARDLVIQAFIDHRLSTVAGLLAVLAWGLVLARRGGRQSARPTAPHRAAEWAAWAGLTISAVGLVLYDADRSAFTGLLCAMATIELRALEAKSRTTA